MKPLTFKHDTKAVSPIISAILLLTIMLITVGAIMTWAIPRIQGMEQDAHYEGVYAGFEVFDTRADDVIYTGKGTSRVSEIGVGGGDLFLAADDGYWMIYWSLIPENITFSSVNSKNGTFTFQFDDLEEDGLTVNITGSAGEGDFISVDGKVEPGFKFGDLQHVRIMNSTHDIAELYYFKIRVLEYRLSTNHGYFEIKWLNGAIISNKGSSIGAVTDSPYIYQRDDNLFINMINLTGNNSGFLSAGRGSYGLMVSNRDSSLLAEKQVYSASISVHSEYSGGWNVFFTNHRNYTRVKDDQYNTVAVGPDPGGYTQIKLLRTDLEITGVR